MGRNLWFGTCSDDDVKSKQDLIDKLKLNNDPIRKILDIKEILPTHMWRNKLPYMYEKVFTEQELRNYAQELLKDHDDDGLFVISFVLSSTPEEGYAVISMN